VAIEGCCHGELEKIYTALDETMERNGFKARPLALPPSFRALQFGQTRALSRSKVGGFVPVHTPSMLT
jgi:hypothetical protein